MFHDLKRTLQYSVCSVPFLMVTILASAFAQESRSRSISPHLKPVILPSLEREAMVGIRLDRDVYQSSTFRFGDLRLLNDQDQEVPFVLRKLVTEKKGTKRSRVNLSSPKIRLLENGDFEIEFEIDPSKYPNPIHGFTFITNLVNFEHKVTVERQDLGGNSWNVLLSNDVIYDYSQFMNVKNTDIALPKDLATIAGGKYRIRIHQATQEQQSQWMELKRAIKAGDETGREEKYLVNRQPFRIERIEFWTDFEVTESSALQLADYGVEVLSIEQDEKTKSTWVHLGSHNEPLTELRLLTDNNNFSRQFRIVAEAIAEQIGSPIGNERVLASTNLSRINLGSVKKEQLELHFPESRESKYRVEISNRDSPALDSLAFAAKGPIYEIVFLARPEHKYRLVYGNLILEAPEYDTIALQSALSAKTVPLPASLGEQQDHQVIDTRPISVQLLSNPWLVGGIIVVLMVVLGSVLRQAGKRLNNLPGGPGASP